MATPYFGSTISGLGQFLFDGFKSLEVTVDQVQSRVDKNVCNLLGVGCVLLDALGLLVPFVRACEKAQ